MKRCSRCREYKDESDYHKNTSKPDGLYNYCKECTSFYKRSYRRLTTSALADKEPFCPDIYIGTPWYDDRMERIRKLTIANARNKKHEDLRVLAGVYNDDTE